MKTSAYLIAAFALATGLSSCKKDWKCRCLTSEYNEIIDDYQIVNDTTSEKSVTRKDAEEWCQGLEIKLDGDSIISCDLVKK